MVWPFKRAPSITLDEAIADKPMPPCGDKREHYTWKFQGFPCPLCAADVMRKQELADEDRLAEKIAQRVAEKINANAVCAAKGE